MYALNLGDNNRILSACLAIQATPETMPRVEALPKGKIGDWLFVNNTYVYDPLPTPPEPDPEPTNFDRLEAQVTYTAMMTDTLLEG